jgi:ElaB/YqjD/DUF883 family membrane-anchored ribosome-binding protein
MKSMKAEQQINALTSQVSELLALLDRHRSPEIDPLRSRIEDTLDSTKRALKPSIPARLGRYAVSLDHYVTGYPRLGFATGLLLGGVIVYFAGLVHPND